MKDAINQVEQPEREEGGRRRDGLGLALGIALVFSALIHAGLALFFILGPLILQSLNEVLEPLGIELPVFESASAPPAPPTPPVMMVEMVDSIDLYGETDRATDISSEPEPNIPPPAPPSDNALLLEPAPPVEAPPSDAIALGPRAETKPPELKRSDTVPPKIEIPEVKAEPKKELKPKEPKLKEPKQTASRENPQNVYDMLGRTLRKDPRMLLGSRSGSVNNPAISNYYNQAIKTFDRNWKNEMANAAVAERSREIFVTVIVEPNGQISNIRMTRASGNAELDRSVERAIKKSSPLPPLPPAFAGKRTSIPVRFTPMNIR